VLSSLAAGFFLDRALTAFAFGDGFAFGTVFVAGSLFARDGAGFDGAAFFARAFEAAEADLVSGGVAAACFAAFAPACALVGFAAACGRIFIAPVFSGFAARFGARLDAAGAFAADFDFSFMGNASVLTCKAMAYYRHRVIS